MSQDITSTHCVEQLPLLLYGELSFDEEERVESHLEACADCRQALERERELSATFDSLAIEPSSALLRQAREDLFKRLEQEPPLAAKAEQHAAYHHGWWDRFVDFVTPQTSASLRTGLLKPAGAFALLAIGFMAARSAPGVLPNIAFFNGSGSGAAQMSLTDPGTASRVRYVESVPDGRVQIVLDETRQRTVSGRMDDENIRGLLLTATRDPADPGLRAETMELLTSRVQGTDPGAVQMAADVKAALIYAVRSDQNAGVRLKAMEGLKSFTGDAEVRAALSDVLLSDTNPAMRNQAIDLLMQGLDDAGAARRADPRAFAGPDARMVSLFEELMKREEKNPYVRQRSQRALELVNAVDVK
jgi:hypothetical protein